MTPAPERSFEIVTDDGVKLRALVAAPVDPTGALVLVHGLTTDANEHGAFVALRDRALRAGLAVVRYDARAHGASGGEKQDIRLVGARRDADAVRALVDDQLGAQLPVVPVGVSFGGAAAVHLAATRQPCAGLVLWYAIVDYKWNYGEDSPVRFTQQMRAERGTGDPPWAAWPVADTGYHIPHGLMEELDADPTPDVMRALEIPVLAYHGSRDWLVDISPLRRIAAQRKNIKVRTAHGAAHGFLLWRPWVIRQTVSWSLRRVQAVRPPSTTSV